MPTIQADDGSLLHYDVEGEGEPLLLIPGLGGDARFWAPARRELAGFRTIGIDHRGAGRSARPPGRYGIGQIAADALRVLDGLGLASAHVLGHSTGGIVAQAIALDAPQRLRRLVLSGTWDRPDARFRMLFEARLAVLLQAGPETYQRLTHVLGFPAEWIEAHQDEMERAVAAAAVTLAPIPVTAARISMLLEADRSPELGGIACPTLVIGAPDDAMIPFHHSERLAAAIPGARLAAIPGGHFYPRIHPERFAGLVRDFLEARP